MGAIALIVLGWLLHAPKKSEPKIEIKEVVKYDTTNVIKRIYVNRYIESPSKTDSVKRYSDTIKGDTLDTKYQITHTISDSQKVVRSWWQVNIEPRFRTITKIVTRDSIQTKINTEYITKPFFLDTYFYTTFAAVFLLILRMIF